MRLGGFSLSRHRYQKGRMLIQNDITYHESITCTETHTAACGRSVTYALVAAGALGVRFWPVSEDRNPKRFGDVTVVTKHVRSVLNILRYDLVTRRIHCAIDITHRDDRRYYDESHTQGGQHFTLTGYTKTLENKNKNYEERQRVDDPFFDLDGERNSCIHDLLSQMAHGPTISRPVC